MIPVSGIGVELIFKMKYTVEAEPVLTEEMDGELILMEGVGFVAGVGVASKAKGEDVVLVLSCTEEVMVTLKLAETTASEGVGVKLALFVMRVKLALAVAISEDDIAVMSVEGELLLVTKGVGIRL